MKTFKTNAAPEGETSKIDLLVKIVCVGGYTGGFRTKGVFIDDYRQVQPDVKSCRRPVVGVDFHTMKWQRSETEKPFLTLLQFWEFAEHEHFSKLIRPFYRFSHGGLVFWGTRRPSSLDEAIKWRRDIRKHLPSIPCVLITDNVAKPGQEPLQWI